MRVRVSYVVDVGEAMRRGIRVHYGKPGLASRQEIKDHYRYYGDTGESESADDFSAEGLARSGLMPSDEFLADEDN